MDRQAAENRITNTFNYPFDEQRFRTLTRDLFDDRFEEFKDSSWITGHIKKSFREHIKKYKRIGKYSYHDGSVLDVIIVHLKKEDAIDSARTMQRNFIASYLKTRGEKEAAVVAYFTDNTDDWRFSYVRMEYKEAVTESGKVKVKEELTPAKRYSFLVGKNEPNHTAKQQLLPLLQSDSSGPTLSELKDAFSVEAVTKQFYQDYKGLFEKLAEELDRILEEDNKIKREFESKAIDTANFAKKLLGQIVFLYFLQKKGWLGVPKDERWGKGNKKFLRTLFEKCIGKNGDFFNDYLEYLFYEALATTEGRTTIDLSYYKKFDCKIPFLNGGLFEPINDYNWQETDIHINNDLFTEIFDTFDLYNFTVREDEPLEKEVAVDPEMLGKVFENLLPGNLRKGQGAYYTPREIVHYMCQKSLINYLDTEVNTGEISLAQEKSTQGKLFGTPEPKQLGLKTTAYKTIIPRKDIENFICKGEFAIENDTAKEEGTTSYKYQVDESIRKNAQLLDEKLKTIKICDPAIGSGAFPVGMMHEIVKARNVLETYLKIGKGLYEFKRHCIQESIYGVDIDPGAIEISKLRLWLSLVVDEENYLDIKPLPNLDYKIMQGNSLIELLSTESLVSSMDHKRTKLVEELKKAKDELFNITIPTQKENKRCEIDILMKKLFEYDRDKQIKRLKDAILAVKSQRRLFEDKKDRKEDKKKILSIESKIEELQNVNIPGPAEHFEWHINYSEIFQDKGGFDVVIANPPYVEQRKLKPFRNIFQKQFSVYSGMADIYVYFYEKGVGLLSEKSALCYITSNKFLKTSYGQKLRDFLSKCEVKQIIDFSKVHIFEALVSSCILIMTKKQSNGKVITSFVNDQLTSFSNLNEFISKNHVEVKQETLGKDIWQLESEDKLKLKQKIEKTGSPISEIKSISINRGITTGYNPAFIIDEVTAKELIHKDKKSKYLIKPLLQGRNIRKWYYNYNSEYLLFAHRSYEIEDYSAIFERLKSFKAELENRQNVIRDGELWWQIPYSISYKDNFEDEKIIWGLTADKWAFAFDDRKHYLPSNGYILTSDGKFAIKYILALLNSNLFKFHFGFVGIMTAGGAYTLKHETISAFPIKEIPSTSQPALITFVDRILSITKNKDYLQNLQKQARVKALEREIDQLVYKLYNLTPEEIKIVEGKH